MNHLTRFRALPKVLQRSAFVALAALAVAGGAWMLEGALEEAEQQLRQTRQDTARIQNDIRAARADIDYVRENLARHDEVMAQKPYADRDRLDARRRIEVLGRAHGLTEQSLSIEPENIAAAPGSDLRGLSLVTTPLTVDAGALLDGDIYAFAAAMRQVLPGYVALRQMEIARSRPLDREAYWAIRRGEMPSLVGARLEFVWRAASQEETPMQGSRR
ncbi:hypothetical protein [Telmatospirillum sp. J64-1]|uniref:hypothetical protein n=1 Tax=Telmatospirillum sp. J64-1 TaxID=2502183 RepID=UPI00115F6BF8|nr:hypothetical protein [Telmatospirillum sp. J64-1]